MKKRLPKFTAQIASLILVAAMVIPMTAFAEQYESSKWTYSASGYTYNYWSILYDDHDNEFRAATWVQETSLKNVPVGYIGAASYVWSANTNRILVQRPMTYNTSAIYFHPSSTLSTVTTDTVYSEGVAAFYTGSGYVEKTAPQTPRVQGVKQSMMAALTADGTYPTTANGETYGPIALKDVVGFAPDLVLAEGTNGEEGYVRNEDLNPHSWVKTPEDAMLYMSMLEQYKEVPLYDLEGNVIGTFELSVDPLPEFDTIEEALDCTARNATNYASTTEKNYYSENDNGKTYGSARFAHLMGFAPDLIAVQGDNDQTGYVYKEDFYPNHWVKNPDDAMRYMSNLPEQFVMPLMDRNENVIGSLTIPMDDIEFYTTIAEAQAAMSK